MKLTFGLPPRTAASALRGIAPHLPALTLIPLSPLPVGTLEITRQGGQIQWQVADEGVTFDIDAVCEMELAPAEFCGVDFVSIVLTFDVDGEPRAYRFVTSHASENEWLAQTAKEIGDLFGLPVNNRLQPQTIER